MDELLIIKTGHCETFSEFEDRGICSLGDVLRTTFLINYYKNYKISWVTDSKAVALLSEANVKVIDWKDWDSVDISKFKKVINLEKNEKLLSYNFEGINQKNLEELRKISDDYDFSYQEKLCLFLKIKWDKSPYKFRSSQVIGDGIGLNWKVGEKFPEKSLKKNFWLMLDKELSKESTVKWQEGFDDINDYINWIDSVETLITLDSLGTHIGIALNKKVICLFGPTNINEVFIYDKGEKIDIKDLKDEQIINLITECLNT